MTAPPADYALPASPPLPTGLSSRLVGLAATQPYVPPAPAPAPGEPGGHLFPGNTARQLRVLLAERGVERTYHSAHLSMAVVSLPGVTVWISPRDLSWTHAGQPATWPATDLPGAADYLATLAGLVGLPAPTGVPWEDA